MRREDKLKFRRAQVREEKAVLRAGLRLLREADTAIRRQKAEDMIADAKSRLGIIGRCILGLREKGARVKTVEFQGKKHKLTIDRCGDIDGDPLFEIYVGDGFEVGEPHGFYAHENVTVTCFANDEAEALLEHLNARLRAGDTL